MEYQKLWGRSPGNRKENIRLLREKTEVCRRAIIIYDKAEFPDADNLIGLFSAERTEIKCFELSDLDYDILGQMASCDFVLIEAGVASDSHYKNFIWNRLRYSSDYVYCVINKKDVTVPAYMNSHTLRFIGDMNRTVKEITGE